MNKEYLNSIRIILLDCTYQRINIQDVIVKLNDFIIELKKLKSIDKDKLIEDNQIILNAVYENII
jgi:hypothetical protein